MFSYMYIIIYNVIHSCFSTKTVTATVGADLPLEYFNWFMNEVYPECKQATPRLVYQIEP